MGSVSVIGNLRGNSKKWLACHELSQVVTQKSNILCNVARGHRIELHRLIDGALSYS